MKLHARLKNIVKIATIATKDNNIIGNRRLDFSFLKLDGTNLVATDGRRLVVMPVELDEGDVDGYISQAAITAACKAKSPLFAGETELHAPRAQYTEPRRAPDGLFPSYLNVIPTFKEGDSGTVTVRLDARMLAEMAAVLSGDPGVSLTFKIGLPRVNQPDSTDVTQAEHGPILVRGVLGEDLGIGVLMPIR